MQCKLLTVSLAGLFAVPAAAQDIPTLDEIVVTATRIPMSDIYAPYASEVHNRRQIEQSGCATLFDYLSQHTTVNVLPYYGNAFTPLLDMRGFGGNGGQNIVVTLDGQSLNNIDSLPQLIGVVPLVDVERIEITQGSGAVMLGDGASAGAIRIITRRHQGVGVEGAVGNAGQQVLGVRAGAGKEAFRLSVSGQYDRGDGHAEPDVAGYKDASSLHSWRGSLGVMPTEALSLGLDVSDARIDTRYPGYMTQAEFRTNPAQNSGNTYNHQVLESTFWRVRSGLVLAPGWRLTLEHGREDKLSNYVAPSPYRSDYDYVSDDLGLQYRGAAFDITAGWQRFDGVRISRNGFGDNDTRKDTKGVFIQGQYRQGEATLSAGVRKENIAYRYQPVAGAVITADHDLDAWNLGLNYLLRPGTTVFASLDKAYQAPNIDSFFVDTDFDFIPDTVNLDIRPSASRTLTLGVNHVAPAHRISLAVYRANLVDEIYYNPLTFANANLDKTHKYGLELKDTWRMRENLSAALKYTWTRALIDREDDGGGAFDGKDLPGVPRHGISLNLHWTPASAWSVNLAHHWRSQAYASEDFANAFTQKQAAWQSTDLSLVYRRKEWTWFASVDNLFEREKGLWVRDDVIYPVGYTRNLRLGLKAAF